MGLEGYECPLWKIPGKNRGKFDESRFEIEYIDPDKPKPDTVNNMQALCMCCYLVYITRQEALEEQLALAKEKNQNKKTDKINFDTEYPDTDSDDPCDYTNSENESDHVDTNYDTDTDSDDCDTDSDDCDTDSDNCDTDSDNCDTDSDDCGTDSDEDDICPQCRLEELYEKINKYACDDCFDNILAINDESDVDNEVDRNDESDTDGDNYSSKKGTGSSHNGTNSLHKEKNMKSFESDDEFYDDCDDFFECLFCSEKYFDKGELLDHQLQGCPMEKELSRNNDIKKSKKRKHN